MFTSLVARGGALVNLPFERGVAVGFNRSDTFNTAGITISEYYNELLQETFGVAKQIYSMDETN